MGGCRFHQIYPGPNRITGPAHSPPKEKNHDETPVETTAFDSTAALWRHAAGGRTGSFTRQDDDGRQHDGWRPVRHGVYAACCAPPHPRDRCPHQISEVEITVPYPSTYPPVPARIGGLC